MRTVAFFNSKGGAGKSTLSIHVGVAASYDRRVALLDADPQGTLRAWSQVRPQESPSVMATKVATLAGDLADMEARGVDLAIIDCPPYITAESSRLVLMADFVIVPAQPTMPDIAGCQYAVNIIKAANKPFVFVVNRGPSRAPEIGMTVEALSEHGTVCPVVIGDRRAFSRALMSGLSVTEMEGDSPASAEAASACAWLLDRIGGK
jgi:chromosome partitioning protein